VGPASNSLLYWRRVRQLDRVVELHIIAKLVGIASICGLWHFEQDDEAEPVMVEQSYGDLPLFTRMSIANVRRVRQGGRIVSLKRWPSKTKKAITWWKNGRERA
jgi:hypothetical protein